MPARCKFYEDGDTRSWRYFIPDLGGIHRKEFVEATNALGTPQGWLVKHSDLHSLWVNPPYSSPRLWLDRIVSEVRWHGQHDQAEIDGSEGPDSTRDIKALALVKADTSTRWWHEIVWPRAEGPRSVGLALRPSVCWFRKRIKFCGPLQDAKKSSATFPCALLVWGDSHFRCEVSSVMREDCHFTP